ncbi:hypothetical protein A2U01_0061572, partial [Trifolium medium]|nr:hypothetical protein [Trifolium medium]
IMWNWNIRSSRHYGLDELNMLKVELVKVELGLRKWSSR